MKFIRLPQLAVLLLMYCISAPSFAEIYKWVDEYGNAHYGDKNKSGQNTDLSIIEVKDHLVVKKITDVEPISYSLKEPSNFVSFTRLTMEITNNEQEQATYGQIQVGRDCSRGAPILWSDGHIDLDDGYIYATIIENFQKTGYQAGKFSPNAGLAGGYQLKGSVVSLKSTVCIPNFSRRSSRKSMPSELAKSAVYLKIRWELSELKTGTVKFTQETEGYHSNYDKSMMPVKLSINYAFEEALGMSVRYLLHDNAFVKLLDYDPNNTDVMMVKREFNDNYEVSVTISSGSGSFTDKASSLKQSSVTIKSNGGHGSGVIIDEAGFALTNAHVVGDAERVEVKIGDGNYQPGKVVRRDDNRDVALIKLERHNDLDLAPISAVKPSVGEEFYVIGTPLDESLSHTITRGIYSSPREMKGLTYYQTDASINPGNSGGPVFNKHGNLVALSVAGIFTRDGAGVNVNYVIPIEDALDSLGIEKRTSLSGIGDSFAKLIKGEKGITPIVQEVKNWLNEPVFTY